MIDKNKLGKRKDKWKTGLWFFLEAVIAHDLNVSISVWIKFNS